jgi:hypothetical protein
MFLINGFKSETEREKQARSVPKSLFSALGSALATETVLRASQGQWGYKPVRCGPERENRNEINSEFSKWCGREDSNLHGLPR